MHEQLLLEEIALAAPSRMGQASSLQHGLQCRFQSASTEQPQCCVQVSVLADCSLLKHCLLEIFVKHTLR